MLYKGTREMNRLERLNDWCGGVLNKISSYDNIVTFIALTSLLLFGVTVAVVDILGFLGYLQ